MRRNFKYFILPVALIAAAACSGKKKADIAQKVARISHDPGQCPRLQEGHYNLKNGAVTKFIEVYDDKQNKQMILSFDGKEDLAVNGRSQLQENNSSLTAACIDGSIRIVGSGMGNGYTNLTIKQSNDGGLQVDQSSPTRMTEHFTQAGPLQSTLDNIRQVLMTRSSQRRSSGLPNTQDRGGTQQQQNGPRDGGTRPPLQ